MLTPATRARRAAAARKRRWSRQSNRRRPGHLILLYEKDNAPAKVRRAAEKPALLVNCMRPFDNQIEQYVNAFVQSLGLKLSPAALDLIISRHGGDLAAVANTLGKVTIFAEPGKAGAAGRFG